MALDARVKAALKARGVEALSFNGRLMREPWEVGQARRSPGRHLFRLLAPASRAWAPARSDASAQTRHQRALASRSARARVNRSSEA